MMRDEAYLLAHKRRVDAERKAQAILRARRNSPAALMARVAAAPIRPHLRVEEFRPVTMSTTPRRIV